jgi:chaperonin GroEL
MINPLTTRQVKPTPRRPDVVFQPAVYRGLQRGIGQLVDAIRPTLGPLPRVVAYHQLVTNKMPEMLTKGGIIARRIIQLPDRNADMGAMLLRHLLCRLHEEYGDGTATAAVLFGSIFDQSVTYLASGGNATRLRHYLEQGMHTILNELSARTLPVDGKEQLAHIAESICYDPPLARLLGEVLDVIGEHGQLEIRPVRSRELYREYMEGMSWKADLFSRDMLTDAARTKVMLENPAILITDLEIEDPRDLLPAITAATQNGLHSLVIVATRLSPAIIATLLNNRQPDKFEGIAVRTPGLNAAEEAAALEDLAILTGGRPFLRAAGDNLHHVAFQDLGQARRVWANMTRFSVVAGRSDPRRLREHIRSLRAAAGQVQDQTERRRLLQRLGQLMGGVATLYVGGATELEIQTRKELAEQTAGSLRAAIREGVLPGGGTALLDCRPALRRGLDSSTDTDERAAYRILLKAVEAPARTILANAGLDASELLARVNLSGPGHGFDVMAEQVVEMAQAGVFDVAAVQKAAVTGAIATAGLALSVDVLVHHKRPEEALSP